MYSNRPNTQGAVRSRATCANRHWLVALCCGALLWTAGAKAETISLVAGIDPSAPSLFTLDFGEFGGRTTGYVINADIELEVDADAGTARFVHYYSDVEPLTLPGGISTGDLTIEMVEGSSSGTYDEVTGEFSTSEVYAIYFAGDLSAFGLESPVYLPSVSAGMVTLDLEVGGYISRSCTGAGQMDNPFDPLNPLDYSYTCSLNANFAPEARAFIRLALIPEVVRLELASTVEAHLLAILWRAIDALAVNNHRLGGLYLRVFIGSVEDYAGGQIADDDADVLIDMADAIASILRRGVFRR